MTRLNNKTMSDLAYDIETRDIIIENGDFVIKDELSDQNGGVLLTTKNTNLSFPLAGVAIHDAVNSGAQTMGNYLNRWQSQTLQDGAKSANWTQDQDKDGNLIFQTNCNYD
jgi:hypothetical protein